MEITPLLLIAALGAVAFTMMGKGLEKALTIIREFEGFSPKKYKDSEGWSIGYGHFIKASEPYLLTTTITKAQAEALLVNDVKSAADTVAKAVKTPLNENQRAALISFCYNIGEGGFRSSTLVQLLNKGDTAGAAAQFDRWVFDTAGGSPRKLDALVDRRNKEKALFLS